jgi:cell division protein FtsI (penicillin-binding protein 3)
VRGRDLRLAARRVAVTRALLLLAFAGLAARAAHLSVVDDRGAERGEAQSHRLLTLPPERGTIVDRAGATLAISVDAPSIYAVSTRIDDVDRTAASLSRVLGMPTPVLADRLRGESSFRFLERWVSAEQARRVEALGLPGVGVLREPRRVYPYKQLAARVVGFANIDAVGVRGIEQQENRWLRGTARRLPVERDARGQLLVSGGQERWSTAGGDVALTIDATLQADAESALREAMGKTGARRGFVISMDPHSGDLLALAELPSFDPNGFRKLDYDETRSRAFLDAAEPGSTLKTFLIAAALERGVIGPDDRFDCENGVFEIPGKTIRDHHPHGELTAPEILQVSSNIGAAKIALALGPRAHYEMLRRFGFGEPTRSHFPDESAGVLRSWRSWRPVDHVTIAFGQGISATPIQLVDAMATIANGGQRVQPRLVAARRVAGRPWQPNAPAAPQRVVSPETAAAVTAMLEGVVAPDGTGAAAALRGVRVAGKTGTAQKLDPTTGRYAPDRFDAWFVGVVPADDPKLVILAGLDEPRRPTHTGGAAAAPLFARVAAAQLSRFGIFTAPQPARPRPVPTRTARAVPAPSVSSAPPRAASAPAAAPKAIPGLVRIDDRVLLPDLRGLTVEEVKRITAEGALAVEISGSGRAIAQEPPPGTVLAAREGRVRVRFAQHPGVGREGEG